MKLIVGVDPGITTALALIDVNSGDYWCFSRKDFTLGDICNIIVEYGDPIIIATDTKKVPGLVKKICSVFECRLFLPKKDIMVGEKKSLTENMEKVRNDHERDALASAFSAKNEFASLFRKIDKALEKKNMTFINEDVKDMLVRKEVGNIEQAIEFLTQKDVSKGIRIVPKLIETKKILQLKEKMRSMEKRSAILEEFIKTLQQEKSELREEIMRLKRKKSGQDIINLRKSMECLREEKERLAQEFASYKKIKQLERYYEIILPFSPDNDVMDKVVIVEGNVNIVALENARPKAVIADKILPTNLPVIPKEKLNIQRIDNFLVADKKHVEQLMQENFLTWLKTYKNRHTKKIR